MLFVFLLAAVGAWGDALDPGLLVPSDVGGPSIAGSTTVQSDSIVLVADGQGIGFAKDQFHFAATPVAGDFDLRVRVSRLKNTDLWAKAGLMLRADWGAGARFAGVFATPTGAGCLFQARPIDSGSASNRGFFPANQPFTWLRLRREGDLVSAYAGYDGRRWTMLGNQTVAWPTNALLGLAATSHSTNATVAEFRDLGDAVDPVVEQVPVALAPLGPCSRRTPIVISEIMYHPPTRSDGKDLEFVELYNSQPYYEDISGWRLTGDIEFVFPSGTVVPGGGFIVVAVAPADVQAAYSLDGVLGPYSGHLSNGGGKLRLVGDHNAVFLDLAFKDKAPWPELADGSGHSLVLVRPSYGEADPRAWAASRVKGGSPGMPEAVELTSTAGLRINECQLPDPAGAGFVELFNSSSVEADLGGVRLGPSVGSLPFAVPAGTKLAPGGYIHFTWSQLGFALRPTGDRLYLESADQSRFLDAVTFGPQVPGTSAGRWPNGGDVVCALPQPTPGSPNVHPQTDLVINEIHYSPVSGDANEEFIELYNASYGAADLGAWQFTAGVSFTFPTGTSIPAGGYLVVAHNAARLMQLYPNLDPGQIVGDFTGKLSGLSDHLVLSRPITVTNSTGSLETVLATVSEASYTGGGRWHPWSDAGGSTLELTDSRANANCSSAWADSEEASRSDWTTVEWTGVLDNGGGATPDSLHVLLLGEGECLIDNVEVIGPDGTNRIVNSTFEQGLAGWTCSGNHIRSSLETSAGYQSSQSLHVRASGNGDTGANRIYTKLSRALAAGNTATLRARVKWLSGWPEILLRLHGNYLEAYGRLDAPTAPGTPGARNSRAVVNGGPAVAKVSHFPAVPGTNEPVVVTALVDDPDGVGAVTLYYRLDPGSARVSVSMRDDGTAGDAVPGDGIYSAIIPAPGAAKLVAFTIEATDQAARPATTVFPPGAPARECLVRFGDASPSGAFGTYRLWVTQTNSDAWKNRPILSNEPIESTFVYDNCRVVYNAGGRFAGSPFHQSFTSGPASQAHFVVELPNDDRVLGTASFNKLHAPGNGAFDDAALQREQVVYWMARQFGLPWLHRRFFHFIVNGAEKRNLMEDTQVGSDDLVKEFWPQDPDGNLYKMQPWFEFADSTSQVLSGQNTTWLSINRYTTTGGQYKLARYRWNWATRGADGTANDYTNVFQFITVATDTSNAAYETNVASVANVDEWFRTFAINHAVGNWDSVGYRNGQNTYAYKPRNGPWELVIWDANIVLGNGSDGPSGLPLFSTADATLSRWFSRGGFKRRFLTAYYELVNGPMQTNLIAPILNAKYAAFQEHGIKASSPDSIRAWIASARNYILSQVNKSSAPFSVTNLIGFDQITLAGTGPLNMAGLSVNGSPVDLTWDTTSAWRTAPISVTQTNALFLVALDSRGAPLAGTERLLTVGPGRNLLIRQDGGELVLQYQVFRSGPYELQAATDLAAPDWKPIATGQASTSLLELRIPVPQASPTFYRLSAL